MTTQTSILACNIPWSEESSEPKSMRPLRVRHNWGTEHTHIRDKCRLFIFSMAFWKEHFVRRELLSLKWSEVQWKVLSHVQLFATPWIIHGILQARILEWVAFAFSRRSSQPRDRTQVSHIAGRSFTSWATREALEYWSGYPIPSPVDLPNPGIELESLALQADS